jgi:hypothetical protein
MERVLAALEPMLYGFNYQVFLRAYKVATPEASPLAAFLSAALGPSVAFRDETECTVPSMIADVEECLRYRGDSGSGPEPAVLDSAQFNEHLELLKTSLAAIANDHRITRVFVTDGHPAYPVFWDFTYVVAGKSSFVLVGCSSD